MSYYTISEIRSYSNNVRYPVNENANRLGKQKTTIFLSHSHADSDIIKEIVAFFLALDIYIYVDWLDPSMPAITSVETAKRIKSKIKQCDKFVVLLTENSKNSKWVPWELGWADGVKTFGDIAIFPVLRTVHGDFKGVEYMEIYPKIQEGNLEGRRRPAVFPPTEISTNGKWLTDSWIHQRNLIFS
jgi:TIR domain